MKKTILILLILCLSLAALSCAKTEKAVRAPGTVDGQVLTVRSLVSGTLVTWTAKEGAAAAKDELLGEVDPSKVQNAIQAVEISRREVDNQEARLRKKLEDIRANVAYLKKQVDRLARLKAEKAVAGDQLDKTELLLLDAQTTLFDLDKSLASLGLQKETLANKLASLELSLKDLRVVSPVRGVILESFVSQGETLLPGTALADILDLDSLYVEVFLEEKEVASLKLNDPVQIALDGLPSRSFAGTISYFGRKAEFSPKYILSEKERQALLYQVKIRLGQDLEAFKVGMPVTVTFGSR